MATAKYGYRLDGKPKKKPGPKKIKKATSKLNWAESNARLRKIFTKQVEKMNLSKPELARQKKRIRTTFK